MLRLIVRLFFILIIVFSTVIVVFMQSGHYRYDTLMLYTQTQYNGFRLWDMQTQQFHNLMPLSRTGIRTVWIPTWSPDGEQLAFVMRENHVVDGDVSIADNLYIVDASGRNLQRILDNSSSRTISRSGANPLMRWAPDGQMIAFYLDIFSDPRLWIVSIAGEVIATADETLPTGGLLMWSADSETVYVVLERQELSYQTLDAVPGALLSSPTTIILPESPVSMDAILPSPVAGQLLVYDDSRDVVWLADLERDTYQAIEQIQDNNLTALAWSHNGSRIGWVQRDLRASRIHTLDLASGIITDYQLSPEIANDLSFNIQLPDNPPQVIVYMQRGLFCRNIGVQMHCSDPDLFAATWSGMRP